MTKTAVAQAARSRFGRLASITPEIQAQIELNRRVMAQEAARLAGEGKTVRQIGELLGVSRETARTLAREGRAIPSPKEANRD